MNMKPGSLVIKSSRWEPDSKNLGIAIQESETRLGSWIVLWTKKSSYSLKEHLETALIELDGTNDHLLIERTCTSK